MTIVNFGVNVQQELNPITYFTMQFPLNLPTKKLVTNNIAESLVMATSESRVDNFRIFFLDHEDRMVNRLATSLNWGGTPYIFVSEFIGQLENKLSLKEKIEMYKAILTICITGENHDRTRQNLVELLESI